MRVLVRNLSDLPADDLRLGASAWDHESRPNDPNYGDVNLVVRTRGTAYRGFGHVRRFPVTLAAGESAVLRVKAYEKVPDAGREGGIMLWTFTSLNAKFGYSYPVLEINWDGDTCASVWEDDESCS